MRRARRTYSWTIRSSRAYGPAGNDTTWSPRVRSGRGWRSWSASTRCTSCGRAAVSFYLRISSHNLRIVRPDWPATPLTVAAQRENLPDTSPRWRSADWAARANLSDRTVTESNPRGGWAVTGPVTVLCDTDVVKVERPIFLTFSFR